MTHEWHRGVLDVLAGSSWHGLEELGTFTDAHSMMDHGRRSGAWPVALHQVPLFGTVNGQQLKATRDGIAAEYMAHPLAMVGAVGDRYRATAVQEWESVVTAAIAAGAKPTGAFSLRNGSRVLATFEVGKANGLREQLLLADAFDGSMRLSCGFTMIRVVCANTLAAAFASDGDKWAQIRHTASLETKVKVLEDNIGLAIKSGEKVRTLFERASQTYLPKAVFNSAFDALFPPAPKDATANAIGRADSVRDDAVTAGRMPINRVGDKPGNLATLWNAATYLVDRQADGSARPARGGADKLDSMLFGARNDRVSEILSTVQTMIELVKTDGTIETVTAAEALTRDVDKGAVGRRIISDMLGE